MFIKRRLLDQISAHLENPQITLITGPRQAGKTTLMEAVEKNLKKKGKKTIFFNLDLDRDRPYFQSQDKLLERLSLEIGEKGYVFIDEIQRKENAGLFLKGLYDMKLPYKFIASGSGSIELKEKIHESLPGRKRLFELPTLTFEEFIDFKTNYKYTKQLTDFFAVFDELSRQYLEEYLNFGGYPKVVLAQTTDEKTKIISDIYQSFLEKDISILLNIQKTESLTNLVRTLASQIGNLVNVAELSNTLGLSIQTVKKYLWYLEKTYIIKKVPPYFKNLRKEITKAPTYYFVDLGLRNYASNQFGNAAAAPSGFLFENFVHNSLLDKLSLAPTTIHFWRTQDKAEVDFVLDAGPQIVPIEVKYTRLKSPRISRSLRSFLSKYKPKNAYVIHLGSAFETGVDNTKVHFVPPFNTQIIIKQNH